MPHPRAALTFKTDEVNLAIDHVIRCVSEISCRMEQNDLKLNLEKKDILLIHSRFREGPAPDYLHDLEVNESSSLKK